MTPKLPDVTPPDGYVYEWKRYSLHGVVDQGNLSRMRRSGWQAVPPQRHGITASECLNATVVGGLILMEKPAPDVLESMRADQRAADNQYNMFARRLSEATGDDIPEKHREHLVKLPSDT